MSEIKRWIVTGASFGAALALVLIIVAGGYSWYQSRPKPPKPWDAQSITANYDYIDTEGSKNTIAFYYTLQNNTEYDYEITNTAAITLMSKLKQQKSLTGHKDDQWLKFDVPVFVPAKQRLRFGIHFDYPYDKRATPNATGEERAEFRKALAAFVRKELSNHDGFILFDETKRYQVDLPAGW